MTRLPVSTWEFLLQFAGDMTCLNVSNDSSHVGIMP